MRWLAFGLLGVAALDELLAGVPALAAPDAQVSFDLSYAAVSGLLLIAPLAVGLLFEPPLFILADRYPRKWFVCGGLIVMGLSMIVAGLASSPWLFGLALTGVYVGSGCGVGLSQATLMDLEPGRRERMMTRWTFLSACGDLAAPVIVASLAVLTGGWRLAFLATGALVMVWALPVARQCFPRTRNRSRDTGQPTVAEAVRSALGNRRLLAWLLACWLCELLDEILVVFASLHLRNALGATASVQAIVLACFTIGSLLGLALSARLLARQPPLRILRVTATACALSYLVWLTSASVWMSALLLFTVGLFCAPLYPIAKAQAYRALPGQSGMVNAVGNLFGPASIALLLGLGWLAEYGGVTLVLLVLVLQPLGLLAIAVVQESRPAGADGPSTSD